MSLDALFVPQRQTTSVTGVDRPLIRSFCRPIHTNSCLCMGKGATLEAFRPLHPPCSSRKAAAAMAMPPPSGRSRSLPRVRTAGQRTKHLVCVEVHAPAARFLCVAALGRRQAAARQLASCYPRAALRADAALGVQTELVVVGSHKLA